MLQLSQKQAKFLDLCYECANFREEKCQSRYAEDGECALIPERVDEMLQRKGRSCQNGSCQCQN